VFGIVNSAGARDEQEQSTGGFTRPTTSARPAQQQHRPATNPVSHHTQAIHSLSQTTPSPHSHTHPRTPQSHSHSHSPPELELQSPPPQTHPQQPQEEQPFTLFSTDEREPEQDDEAGQTSTGPAIQL
jgi:hypothetical protein